MSTNERDSARERLLQAALQAFHAQGFHRATVAHIRDVAQVSNGSFFHCFASKEALAAQLYLRLLADYHTHMQAALQASTSAADGIAALVRAHAAWVMAHREGARFLGDQTHAEAVREQQAEGNAEFRAALQAWRSATAEAWLPLPMALFMSQLIGPVQLLCRRWLVGRPETDMGDETLAQLVLCAQRALLKPSHVGLGQGLSETSRPA